MRIIHLTKGQCTQVDDDDYDILAQWKWHATTVKGGHHYAARLDRRDGHPQTIYMHRLINSTPSGFHTDHIDGNRLNNQKSNLRTATHRDNLINNTKRMAATSKYRGVSWCRGANKWRATIVVNYRQIFSRLYPTEIEAKKAYDAKRAEIHAGKIYRNDGPPDEALTP